MAVLSVVGCVSGESIARSMHCLGLELDEKKQAIANDRPI